MPVTIQLDKGLTIAGKVLNDATGNPLSGAEFFVTPVDKNEGGQYINSDEKSAADGSFDFSTLKPIDYWLGCRDGRILGGDGGGMGRIRVRGGQQNPVVVRIIPHKGVRLIENGRPILHIP